MERASDGVTTRDLITDVVIKTWKKILHKEGNEVSNLYSEARPNGKEEMR